MLARRLPGILPPLTRAGGARGDAYPLGRGSAASGRPLVVRASVSRSTSRRIRAGGRRRRSKPASGRGLARASRRASPRRAAGVPALGARGAAAATGGRRGRGRARRWARAVPGALPARRDDEHVPVRRARRSGRRVRVHGAAARGISREALACAARSFRPRGRDAAAACGGARRAPGRAVGCRARARRRCRASGCGSLSRAGRTLPPSSSRARSTGCRSRVAAALASPVSRARSPRWRGADEVEPAHVAEALSYRMPGELAAHDATSAAFVVAMTAFPASARSDPRSAAGGSSFAAAGSEDCSRGPRSPSSARVRARRTVDRSRARSPASLRRRASSSSAGWLVGSTARRTAVRSRPAGSTVAVLGCGIDRDYPAAHAELARRICERGLVVSEYEPGVEPAPWRFPARNRIIAGLCAGDGRRRGARAKRCADHGGLRARGGRDVLAVPGEITSSPLGGHERLFGWRDSGDRVRGCPRALRPGSPPSQFARSLGETAQALLSASRRRTALTADEIARAAGVEPAPLPRRSWSSS